MATDNQSGKPQRAGLDSPAKRARLAPRANPHWVGIGGGRGGLSLGYRRPAAGPGTWVAKLVGGGLRREQRLGAADDAGAGPDALAYTTAVAAALAWAERLPSVAAVSLPPLTVRAAIEAYLPTRLARGEAGRDAAWRLRHHVLGSPLAELPLAKLTAEQMHAWREGIARGGTRVGRSKAPAAPLAPASINRLLNDLRAALNAAVQKHRRRLPAGLAAEIEDGLRALRGAQQARQAQLLTEADLRRLASAAEAQDADFGALVWGLAATGARFSQAARIACVDVQVEACRIMVPTSSKGGGGTKVSHTAVPVAPDVIARLRPLLAGRPGHAKLLLRWKHRRVAGDPVSNGLPRWVKDERLPWLDSSAMMRSWVATLKAAELPAGLVPYALRHTSIVRGLRKGLPVRLVAALHDTSTAMIEKHYSAFITDATQELARQAVVSLAPAAVTPLRVTG